MKHALALLNMDVDLDKYSVGPYYLGKKDELESGSKDIDGCTIFFNSHRVTGFHLRFSTFYSKGPLFVGNITKDGKILNEGGSILPDKICEHFGNYDDHWDDDTEVNYQFVHNDVRIEFSWHWSGKNINTLIFNYIMVEIE